MLERFLKAGAAFDWISPTAALFQDLTNGPAAMFKIAPDAGWSTFTLYDLLQNAGVQCWGMMLGDDCISFCTRQSQARYTCYLLERTGVQYETSWDGAEEPAKRRSPKRTSEPETHHWLDTILQRVERLLDRI
jgi:hypothetical protein